MHVFEGDLLIGGLALKKLHGELQQEEQVSNSHDWLLAGRMRLSSQQAEKLRLERRYLLMLSDGREGLVELTRLSLADGDLLADFKPLMAKPVAGSPVDIT